MAAILFLPFKNQTGYFLTSLDRFGMNKIFLMTLINKTVYSSPNHLKTGTGIRSNPNTDHGLYLVGHCIKKKNTNSVQFSTI